jgi:ArsR family transcriptional regulator, arsenate/arsenite/antimonite-responsive transcriptional repressor
MNTETKRHYESRARIAKALAHPSRLLILDALQEQERCVCELTELVGADQSTVSKHLAILRGAGIIEDRKQANLVYYRLRCKCIGGFFKCLESVLNQNLRVQLAVAGSKP